MSTNSSNDSLLRPNLSPIKSSLYCLTIIPSSFLYAVYLLTNIILMLPLCILILYLSLQRWRRQRSTSTAAMTRHSDSFTYHLVAIDLFGVFGYILCCCGIFGHRIGILSVGYWLWSFVWYGETFFYTLTCMEHYLAAVHPVTYLSLRRERGIRIRNIIIGCIWLLCLGAPHLGTLEKVSLIFDFSLIILSLTTISFCSLSVLCVLIHPGPGEQGGDKERVDQSKQRSFYTIVAILGALLLRCVWSLTWSVITALRGKKDCETMALGVWFNLPGSLVLPLLFLHRVGKLPCCKNIKLNHFRRNKN